MKQYFLCIAIALSFSFAYAQQIDSSNIEIGKVLLIHSSILKEDRKINIYFPKSYPFGKLNYPVLYVLDAGALFVPTVGAVQFMNYASYVGQIPEAIVVGILNTNRDRDMPVPQKFMKTDGAKNFLSFITQELIPFVNTHYPVNGLNILIGHSQGGLFATYAGLEEPKTFRFVLSLDAPMTIVPEVLNTFRQRMKQSSLLHYYSAETLYGWGNALSDGFSSQDYSQIKIENETHETMPYKGIYEGLRFFFKEHVPGMNDLSLPSLQGYYSSLSKKYSCDYSIPEKILINKAMPMMIGRLKKKESIELIEYYESVYGRNTISQRMTVKANAITAAPDERVEYYLNLPNPSAESLKPFLGKWKGTLFVPGGMNTDIEWTVQRNDGKYFIEALIMNEFKLKNDFLSVINNREIHWGRKHQGGGIYLSKGKLSNDGLSMQGTEDLIGHFLSEGEPKFIQNSFQFEKIE